MKNHLASFDRTLLLMLKDIGRQADKIPVNAYVVGGPVRDILLKRKVLDLDIVVEGDAAALARQWAQKISGAVTVHPRFGTATVRLKRGQRIDFATARQEEYPAPGALPVVKAGFIHDDLFRRDFTINAMALRINQDRFGQLVDEFGGQKDLTSKKVRVLHEQSFRDDPTRLLRAVRFEQRLGFAIEPKTLSLLKKALENDSPDSVKAERYFAEFRKILQEANPSKGLMRLARLDGLKFLGNQHKMDTGSLGRIERNLRSYCKKETADPKDVWIVYLMGLVHRWSEAELSRLGEHFNLTRQDRVSLASLPALQKVFVRLKKRNLKASKVFRLLESFSYEAVVFLRSYHADKVAQKYADDFLSKYRHVSLALNGHDLKKLGLREGKLIKVTLDHLLKQKLDGKIKTKKQEQQEAEKFVANVK